MNLPLTKSAQDRATLLALAHDLAGLTAQINGATTEGAYTLALGHSQLALTQLCALKGKLERLALEQRN